ncbi:low molecular weight protein tyrosine phosphatase family protein [Acinetobacter sp. Marseille-Q1618]|uniref:low molecular weight protein tyrosine phosphatase family protein n=1 Tax=Acinetobacter sp. Marseille-Q1618 TaxID=2697502 RepID=UPI00156FD1D2|nr:protein tyrosine phosphatase [Acinetobacter sp. Marseille-Q1618]
MKTLFICSRNQWRSPTAERVFAVGYGISTRSAGTSRQAQHTISSQDIAWADLIFVMEHKHKQNIKQKFPQQLQHKKIVVLDIPDDYHYMDEELIELLQAVVTPYLDENTLY